MTIKVPAPLKPHVEMCRKVAPHAEHIGFVAYAGCEVFSAHAIMFIVSVWLFATGLVVTLVIDFAGKEL